MSSTPTERLRKLVENGIAKRFDLTAWARDTGCAQPTALSRLEATLEQIRPDVVKLIVMESLEGTGDEDLDTMVYGETNARAFLEFVNKYAKGAAGLDANAPGVFYDLGSGAGKSVVTAALSPYFRACYGIEILPCAHAIAECVIEDFLRDVAPRDDGVTPTVSARLGDIFSDTSWTEADFVFCNCVTWDESTIARLTQTASSMRSGSIFVTVLCPLAEPHAFDFIAEEEIAFSWGHVEALVYKKT